MDQQSNQEQDGISSHDYFELLLHRYGTITIPFCYPMGADADDYAPGS
jgi:hypothetical protein